MKIFILGLCFAFLWYSCKQKEKITVEKFTDTAVKDTAIKPSFVDSAGADSLKKIFQEATNDTIFPGVSIGCIKLNQTTGDVIKALGQPDSSDAAMGKSLMKWFSKPTGKGIDTAVNSISVFSSSDFGSKDERRKIIHIRITSPYFKTPEHVGCGSTLTFIKMQYPAIKKATANFSDKTTGKTVQIYDEIKQGIAFEINEATKCIGITVHLPGKKAWESYFVEYGPLKKDTH